ADAVSVGEHPLAPRPQEVALAVEDHHRMFRAVEDVDVVVPVDPHRRDVAEGPALGQRAPVLDDAVPVVALAQYHAHVVPSLSKASIRIPRHGSASGSTITSAAGSAPPARKVWTLVSAWRPMREMSSITLPAECGVITTFANSLSGEPC